MKRSLLTTVDNPFNPAENYEEWLNFDEQNGYYTNAYLGRIANTSIYLTDAENQRIINAAIDDIIRLDTLDLYRRVVIEE